MYPRRPDHLLSSSGKASEDAAKVARATQMDPLPLERPGAEPQEDTAPLEELVLWDRGLNTKEKKKKEK